MSFALLYLKYRCFGYISSNIPYRSSPQSTPNPCTHPEAMELGQRVVTLISENKTRLGMRFSPRRASACVIGSNPLLIKTTPGQRSETLQATSWSELSPCIFKGGPVLSPLKLSPSKFTFGCDKYASMNRKLFYMGIKSLFYNIEKVIKKR